MLMKYERHYDLDKCDAWRTQYFGASKPKNAMRGIRNISGLPNRKNATRGIRNISGPRNTSNVWLVPHRPHPKRSAKYAFFARLRSGGVINNIIEKY